MGFTPEQIAVQLANDEARRPAAADPDCVEVLECNWDAVQVWMRCQQTYVSGPAGGYPLGIAATEVAAVSTALQVPLDADLLDSVRVLAAAHNKARSK